MGLKGQLYLSGKGLLCIQKIIPPNNVFACKTHKCILTIEDSQTTRTLKNMEWPGGREEDGSRLEEVLWEKEGLCNTFNHKDFLKRNIEWSPILR